MKIADKMIKGELEPTNEELKFLLWNSLIQLSAYCDEVDCVEEEQFYINELLNVLDCQLGMVP